MTVETRKNPRPIKPGLTGMQGGDGSSMYILMRT